MGFSSAELRSSRVVVKRCRRDPKNGMESRLGSMSMMEFEAKIPKKIGLPYCIAISIILVFGIFETEVNASCVRCDVMIPLTFPFILIKKFSR